MRRFFAFLNDEKATTSIEYALICMMITLVVVVAIRQVGFNLTNTFLNTVAAAPVR